MPSRPSACLLRKNDIASPTRTYASTSSTEGLPDPTQLAACAGLEKRLSSNPADLTLESSFILQAAGVDTIELEGDDLQPSCAPLSREALHRTTCHRDGRKLKAMGFKVGVHLVPGLPGSDVEDAINDAHTVSQCGWATTFESGRHSAFKGRSFRCGQSPVAGAHGTSGRRWMWLTRWFRYSTPVRSTRRTHWDSARTRHPRSCHGEPPAPQPPRRD